MQLIEANSFGRRHVLCKSPPINSPAVRTEYELNDTSLVDDAPLAINPKEGLFLFQKRLVRCNAHHRIMEIGRKEIRLYKFSSGSTGVVFLRNRPYNRVAMH